MRTGQGEPGGAAYRVEPEGVDHGGQPPAEPHAHDVLKEREGVVARREIVLTGAGDSAQLVARDDDVRGEVCGRPGALARRPRSDEDDQAGAGKVDDPGHRACTRLLTRPVCPPSRPAVPR